MPDSMPDQHCHHIVVDINDTSIALKTSRWSCQELSLRPVAAITSPPIPTTLLAHPSQGLSGKHSASHANDARGPDFNPADWPAFPTSRRKPLR